MEINQMIPEKVTMSYVELNELNTKYCNTCFCFFNDSKSTAATKSRVGDSLLYLSRHYREGENNSVKTIVLENNKFQVELVEGFSEIYDGYLKNYLVPVRLIHKGLPANKVFFGLFPKSSILELITSVGNLSNRLVLGNVCINLDTRFNSRFFRLVHENPTNKDYTVSKSIGKLRELNGKTTKWTPGNIYYSSSKRIFYLYLGKYDYDCCVSLGYSRNNITQANTSLINYYSSLELVKNPEIYVSLDSIANFDKGQDFGEYIKNNFLNLLESGYIFIKSEDSPKISAINCGNYLKNADINLFNISVYIKNVTKKKILKDFDYNFKKLSPLFNGLFTFNPDLFNEDKKIFTSYLESKASLWRDHFSYYAGSDTFSEFYSRHKSTVESLLIKSTWIKLLSIDERYKICEKVYNKTKN